MGKIVHHSDKVTSDERMSSINGVSLADMFYCIRLECDTD